MYVQTNNYQAIIVSDSVDTFVVFNYMCGEMQWSGLSNPAVVGYNANNGRVYENHPASNLHYIDHAVSCVFEIKNRRKRQLVPRTWIYHLPKSAELVDLVQDCKSFLDIDKQTSIILGTDPQAEAAMLLPCPQTKDQAMLDRKYMKQPENDHCYVTAIPMRKDLPPGLINVNNVDLTQQCCYQENG